MQTLTAHQLREQLRAPDVTLTDFNGRVIDEDAAIAAYESDPARFHQVTPDNPTGDPVANLILNDGPWWIVAEGDE